MVPVLKFLTARQEDYSESAVWNTEKMSSKINMRNIT